MNRRLNESDPMAQIARFDSWPDVKFEMAYIPGPNDYLKWSLGPNYKAGPFAVPFAGPNGNSIAGRLYGTNTIPILNTMICSPYVNPCAKNIRGGHNTRAPDQGAL